MPKTGYGTAKGEPTYITTMRDAEKYHLTKSILEQIGGSKVCEGEFAFQQEVVRLAEDCGWRVYFTRFSLGSPKGYPDLHMVRPPEHIFAELKLDDAGTTIEQRQWLIDLQQCGVTTYLWRPQDWDAIQQVLAGE